MDLNTVLDNLVASLKPSDPYKVILFGSYAHGNPNGNKEELHMIKKHGNYFIDEIERTGKIIYGKARFA